MSYTIPKIAVLSVSFLYPMLPTDVWSQSPAAQRQNLGLPPPPAQASPSIDGIPSAMTTPGLNRTGPSYSIYYVAPNGTDSSTPCLSIASACATVQHALNFATQPGDTVSIIPGAIYGGGAGTNAPVVFSHSGSGPLPGPGGACSSPITLETYPFSHDRAIIAGTRGATGAGAVTNVMYESPPTPVSCIVINRIEFVGWNGDLSWGLIGQNTAQIPYGGSTTYDDYGIEFYGTTYPTQTHHIVIANSYVHDFPGGGIGTQKSDYISVLSNIVTNSSQYSPFNGSCISLCQNQDLMQTDHTITHNIVQGNFASGCVNLVPNNVLTTTVLAHLTSSAAQLSSTLTLDIASPSMYLQTAVDGSFGGCLAAGTQITSVFPPVVGITPPTTCAISAGTIITVGNITDGHGIIIDNTSCSQSSSCSKTPASGRTLVENNITTANGGAGIQVGPDSNYVDVWFNTTVFDQAGIYETNKATPSDGPISLRAGTTITADCTVANNIAVSEHNVVGIQDASGGANIWTNNLFYGGTYPLPIPGTNNVLTDPDLESAVSDYMASDFRVLPGSPAIAAGSTAYSRTSDYAGSPVTLSGPPTMGAFEMQANETAVARTARNEVRPAFSNEAIRKRRLSAAQPR